jgi:hypothetical protein
VVDRSSGISSALLREVVTHQRRPLFEVESGNTVLRETAFRVGGRSRSTNDISADPASAACLAMSMRIAMQPHKWVSRVVGRREPDDSGRHR